MKLNFFVLLSLALVPKVAFAEGGTCPPGYYPHNAPGVMGCAPIPGYNAAGSSAPATGPQWRLTWGAIAADDDPTTGVIGVTVEKLTKKAAEREAISRCKQGGGKKCRTYFVYENQCAVVASPSRGGVEIPGRQHFQGAPTIEHATRLALPACMSVNGTSECIVGYSACTGPLLQ